jgi:hypothetical protein
MKRNVKERKNDTKKKKTKKKKKTSNNFEIWNALSQPQPAF